MRRREKKEKNNNKNNKKITKNEITTFTSVKDWAGD